ncbi:MAG: (Fe-S)-binding protein [Immundisolibacter sp.]|uniref:(Fe-S)-binding protein n=1 Tax=Immundisolibacter sp. TaxID=1934948 RepID=UPI0019BB8BBF|nr:(Fe-S)-binding protein [Immundisolibacter sp.]MBC7161668.1 (Fe-S)-binding protein [Immundisolibacter sp.]
MTTADTAFARLRRYERALYHCATCNYCVSAVWPQRDIDGVCATLRSHSPAASYSGKGYLATARALLEGEALDLHAVAERAYACTTCGNCEAVCPIDMPPTAVVKALRAELAERGLAPPAAQQLRDDVLARQNPWGAPAAQGADWCLGLAPHPQPTLWLLPGCAASHRHPAEARAAAQLLSVIGFDVGWPQRETCCGAPLAALGFVHEADHQGEALAAGVPAGPVLAMLGGECLAQLRARDRPAESVLQLLHAALHDGRLAVAPRADAPPPVVVAVQDSCHLSKPHHGLGDVDAPRLLREVLAVLGCQITQPAAAPWFAICCGAAGGMAQLQPASAQRMAGACIASADHLGAEALISANPLCAGHLAGSAGARLPVYGICEFIAAHFAVAGPDA